MDTYCKSCLFNDYPDHEAGCLLNIPSLISQDKVSKKDGITYISNYTCLYGVEKSNFEGQTYNIEEVAKFSLNRVKIAYYLFIDLIDNNNINIEYIKNLIEEINLLDIKPKFISFLLLAHEDNYEFSKYISQNIDKNIQWKLHNYTVADDDPYQKIYVNLSTNTNANNTRCILFYKPQVSNNNHKLINSRVNYIQTSQMLEQKFAHVIVQSMDNIDGLFLSFDLYKKITTNYGKELMNIIDKFKEEVKILYYE